MINSSPSSNYPQASGDPEATLRLLAQLPPPEGLADRVHRNLAAAPDPAPAPRFWSLWLPAHRLQFAGAAVLVTAMAASSWTILESRRPTSPAAKTAVPGTAADSGRSAFSSADAERHPATLKPIKVPSAVPPAPKTSSAPKKKPSAAKSRAVRPSASPIDQAGVTAH